ncbi:MAG: hypothetical protein CVU42_03710 [Chloroflexi bacterium HGW-Chloroflexi-4]|jgi:uncharacterized membrane protein|nr:MAG: hypothetical protein CVU42_03710 [Chloroflexi bacterium HGW-Chloroflexi-4]
MDQNPEEQVPLEASSLINESRRRRTRRLIVPSGHTERSIYVNEIASRLVPAIDFYLFSILCAVILGAAILLDHPAIYILAALLAPFMAPLVGLGLSTAVGSFKFFSQSLGSLAIGSAFVFIGGLLSGWISKLIPDFYPNQALFHTRVSIPDLILLAVGTVLAIYLTVRVPKQRSLVASVALAYEVYIPIGVAGFGLASKMPQFFLPALRTAGTNILLVILIGAVVLAFLKLRPFTFFGYLLTAIILGGTAYALIMSSAIKTELSTNTTPSTITQTPTLMNSSAAQITETPKPPTATILIPANATATNTLVPTRTPTVTNTPKPPVTWATINIEGGVYARQAPCYDDIQCPKIIPAIPNNTPVQVLGTNPEKTWVQIFMDDSSKGWVNIIYIKFAN